MASTRSVGLVGALVVVVATWSTPSLAEPADGRLSVGVMAGAMSPRDDANAAWLVGADVRARFSRRFSLSLEAQHMERSWGAPPFVVTQTFDTLGLVPRWHLIGRGQVDPYLGLGVHWTRESKFPVVINCGHRDSNKAVSLHAGVDLHVRSARVGLELVGLADDPSRGCDGVGYDDGRPDGTPPLAGWLLRVHGAFTVL